MADRIAISLRRFKARARDRLATLAQAISNTRQVIANKTRNVGFAVRATSSRNERTRSWNITEGCSLRNVAMIASNSVCACSIVFPARSLPYKLINVKRGLLSNCWLDRDGHDDVGM